LYRTRPAPNQTGSSTVTASYTYDVMHRVTATTYNDGVTQNAKFFYDVNPCCTSLTPTNPIGRMVRQSRNTPCGSPCSGTVYSYDPMGRVVEEEDWTPSNWN